MRPGAAARVRRALVYAREFAKGVRGLRGAELPLAATEYDEVQALVGEIEQALEALSLIEEECRSPVNLWCGAERPGWQKPQAADGLNPDPADRRKAGLGCMMTFDEPWWLYAYRCGTCGAWFHQGCLELHLQRRQECDLAR